MKIFLLTLSLIFIIGGLPAGAEEDTKGSAYIRVLNVASTKPINAIVGNLTFKNVSAFSAYQPLDAGAYNASVDKTKQEIEIDSGQRYSLVYVKKGKKKQLRLIEDIVASDAARAGIRLYNFSDHPARVRATNFNTDLLGETTVGAASAQSTEALTFDVALTVDNVDIQSFPAIAFERGEDYSFLITGSLPKYKAFWVKDSIKKKKSS